MSECVAIVRGASQGIGRATASPLQVRMETRSEFRPACSSPSRRTTSPPSLPIWLAAPRNGTIEISGPERAPFNEIVARYLKAVGDPREVVRDPKALYYGGRVQEWFRLSRAAA